MFVLMNSGNENISLVKPAEKAYRYLFMELGKEWFNRESIKTIIKLKIELSLDLFEEFLIDLFEFLIDLFE